MDCDCVNPNKCMNCFMKSYKATEEYCGVDKEDAWEGIELERLLSLEDKLDEELPAEVYSLKDSWL